MGREIVYCERCGQRLTEVDFTRGKAQDHDGRPFCTDCRPVTEPPAPPSEGSGIERPAANVTTSRRRKATERIPFAQPLPGPPTRRPAGDGASPNIAVFVGVGLAVLVLLVVAVGTTGRGAVSPPPEPAVAVKPPAEPRLPAVDPAAEERRRQIEAQAQERLKERERAVELDRVRSEEAAKRKAAEKPPPEKAPPRQWSDVFVLATNRIQANDYPGAKTLYLEGLATLPGTRPEEVQPRALYCIGLYNLACIYAVEAPKLADARARSQAIDEAFKYLDWALRSDYGKFRCQCHPQTAGFGHMVDDKDMEPLRADARYAGLIQKYK